MNEMRTKLFIDRLDKAAARQVHERFGSYGDLVGGAFPGMNRWFVLPLPVPDAALTADAGSVSSSQANQLPASCLGISSRD